MIISDEELQAYVDGELAPEARARVEAAMAGDVLVAARVEREKRLRAQLRGAFDPVMDEPVPARLRDLLAAPAKARDDTANVVSLPARAARTRWRAPVIALAASVAALALAQWLRAPSGDIAVAQGRLVARGELERRLDRGLASENDPASTVALGLTFRAVDGHVCRSFVAQSSHVAGLACREGDGWSLPVVGRIESGGSGEVRQAASAMPVELLAAIDTRLQGDAFDATQEKAARDAGWR